MRCAGIFTERFLIVSSSGFTFTRVKDQMIQQLLDMGIKDFRVLDALSQVPRHIFLDQALWSRAYENRALTIGYKQTISPALHRCSNDRAFAFSHIKKRKSSQSCS